MTPGDTPEQGGPEWRVSYHPRVGRLIAKLDLASDDFNPTVETMLNDLKRDPKSAGEKKHGRLNWARAYDLRYRGAQWRAVYEVIEAERRVLIWRFEKHDEAYDSAERRR